MANKAPHATKAKASARTESLPSKWESVTWGDIATWAGPSSVARGRAYQRGRRVRDLAISKEGRLLAKVAGGHLYTTAVWWEADVLRSRCTCPVGGNGCKHAVAVVAVYLDMLAKDTQVPIADAEDGRWAQLANNIPEALHEYFDDADESEDLEGSEDSEDHKDEPVPRRRSEKARADDDKIRKYLEAQSREDLAGLVWSLTQRFPDLREEFHERIVLGKGDADRLIAHARKELRRATSEPGWNNSWKGEGYTPDFSRLARCLDRMVELGHADAVVKLSREIMARGMELIGQSNDEGETATAFVECLSPVFRAVTNSTLPPAQKLLFAIDADLKDEYSVIESGLLDTVLESNVNLSDWSAAADELAGRLKFDERIARNFHDKYQRERIAEWLVRALTRAGREDEIIRLREREARITGSYEPLVLLLIEQKRYDDAERWAAEGIQNTLREAPGIANRLAKAMEEIARQRGQWSVVAAHAAREFFGRPERKTFTELVAAADHAGCREGVERLGRKFLETGELPFSVAIGKDRAHSVTLRPGWPLPLPDYLLPLLPMGNPGPHYDVLIDMAIAEGHPDDVLQWYDLWCGAPKSGHAAWHYGARRHADKVAMAVAESHPERALEIYRSFVEENLGRAEISAYEAVAAYLKKMRPIMKSMDRGWEWNDLVTGIRANYRNRPRFMEILDVLDARPILQKPGTRK